MKRKNPEQHKLARKYYVNGVALPVGLDETVSLIESSVFFTRSREQTGG